MRVVMCQGASMSLSQCVSEGGQVLVVHRDVKEPNVCLHEQDGGLGGRGVDYLPSSHV